MKIYFKKLAYIYSNKWF